MATNIESLQREPGLARGNVVANNLTERPTSSIAFDGLMMVLAVWFLAGLFLDGWAHDNNMVDSFFTPWHAILYSGFMVNALAVVWVWVRNINKGYSLRKAIPAGYELTLVGSAIFAVGGVLDLLWHTILGIERNFEALVSPSHLILALGLFLVINGPFRAGWRRTDKKTWISYLPLILSLAFTLSVLTFFTFPFHPFYMGLSARPGNQLPVQMAYGGILLESAILMGCLLLAVRRWQLPFGAMTIAFGINIGLLGVIRLNFMFLPAGIIAGLIADVIILALKPSLKNPVALRIFAFVVPVVLYSLYFIVLTLNGGLSWTVPVWSGAIVLSGVVGLLISFVMLPSPLQMSASNHDG